MDYDQGTKRADRRRSSPDFEGVVVDVRPLVPADDKGLVPLLDVLGYGTERKRATQRIARLVDHPDQHGWVALDGVPIGFATGQLNWMIQFDEPVAELTALAVLPQAAGLGVGTRLLAEFETWAIGAGSRRLKIVSGGHRTEAHTFYERHGYTNSGNRFHKTVGDNR